MDSEISLGIFYTVVVRYYIVAYDMKNMSRMQPYFPCQLYIVFQRKYWDRNIKEEVEL
jgi:hypothetical protein